VFRFLSFDVSPDGTSIALGGHNRPCPPCGGPSAVRVWDTSTGTELFHIGHRLDVNEVNLSPDGMYLVTASFDETAKIVDRTGSVIRVLRDPGFHLHAARFSADGPLVATVGRSEVANVPHVTIWDWERNEIVRTFSGASNVVFDPKGAGMTVVEPGGLVEIRDVESGSLLADLQGPSGGAVTDWGGGGVAYTRDGSRVAVAHSDGTVRLFDTGTGVQQLVLPSLGCTVSAVAFSPDGSKLATTSKCGGVRIWALDINDLLEIARREVPRALTAEECRQYLHVDRCLQA
jgi:WD40 repeat protein